MATALMTELEAVNVILEACGEAPVGGLSLTGLYPLDAARATLTETSRLIQSVGWKFNTEEDFMLAPAGDSTVTLPANMLRFDTDDSYMGLIDPVQRGTRLYDIRNHTYSFLLPMKGTAIVMLDWDDLPQAARQYITVKAARTRQGRSVIPESTYRYTEADEQAAMLAFSETESAVGDYNMLRDSWSVASVLYGREGMY